VKHFNERQERPSKRMLTVEEEHRILEAAPPHLRVAVVLLVQTGGRTNSEGLSLRWDQVDLAHSVIHPGSSVKTTDSAQPLPLSRLACDVLKEWKKVPEILSRQFRNPQPDSCPSIFRCSVCISDISAAVT